MPTLTRIFLSFCMILLISGVSRAADSDGDGVDDIQDAFPNDASKQYLAFSEAVSGIEDLTLRDCISSRYEGQESAGAVTTVECYSGSVSSLRGIQNFTELERLVISDPHFGDISPISKLIDLTEVYISWGGKRSQTFRLYQISRICVDLGLPRSQFLTSQHLRLSKA